MYQINWAYAVVETPPNYKGFAIALLILLITYQILTIPCWRYLRRRKRNKYRYYKADLTYIDGDKETLYIEAFGWIDICLYYRNEAKVSLKRIRHPEKLDEEFIPLKDIIEEEEAIIDRLVEEKEKAKADE